MLSIKTLMGIIRTGVLEADAEVKLEERLVRDYFFGGLEDDDCCPDCHGEGGYHDCGEDSCCCLDPEDVTGDDWVVCGTCGGTGELQPAPREEADHA